jgi:Lon protease-like protein
MFSEKTIPLFPLGLVLLPQMSLPLHIFEERYKSMIGECLADEKHFGIIFFNGTDIQSAGCTASILKVMKRYEDGRLDILTRGENRFVIKEMYDRKPYLEAAVTFFDDDLESEENKDVCRKAADKGLALMKEFASISEVQGEYGFTEKMDFKSISFLIAGCEGFSYLEKQRFLEMSSTCERLKKSAESLAGIIERVRITSQIRKIIGGNGNIKRYTTRSIESD